MERNRTAMICAKSLRNSNYIIVALLHAGGDFIITIVEFEAQTFVIDKYCIYFWRVVSKNGRIGAKNFLQQCWHTENESFLILTIQGISIKY